MTTKPLAFFLYGYDKPAADVIKEDYSIIFGQEIHIFSGSQNEDKTIDELVSFNIPAQFENKDIKIAMFLGFEGKYLDLAVKVFPGSRVGKPIMCTVTESNLQWTVNKLIDHMLEEEKQWRENPKTENKN